MSKLPDELEELSALETMDISHNSFISLPYAVYNMPKLINLNASHNYIIGKLISKKHIMYVNRPFGGKVH